MGRFYYIREMEQISIQSFKTNLGELIIGDYNNSLCLCDWRYRKKREAIDKRIQRYFKAEYTETSTPIIEQTKEQLLEYFSGSRTEFSIPISLAGSEFQIKVWEELQKINYGETLTYLHLSKKLGNTKAIRAVATANGANAISIIVPCHRIIGSDGALIGYAGGKTAKAKLLKLENHKSLQTKLF